MSKWKNGGFPNVALTNPRLVFNALIEAAHERGLWEYLENPEDRNLYSGSPHPDRPYLGDVIYPSTSLSDMMFGYVGFFYKIAHAINNINYDWCTDDSTPDKTTLIRNEHWYVDEFLSPGTAKFSSAQAHLLYRKLNLLRRLNAEKSQQKHIEYRKEHYERTFDTPYPHDMSNEEILSHLRKKPFVMKSDPPGYNELETNWTKYPGKAPYAYAQSYCGKFGAGDSFTRTIIRHSYPRNVSFEFFVKRIVDNSQYYPYYDFWGNMGNGDWIKLVFPSVPPGQEIAPLSTSLHWPTNYDQNKPEYDQMYDWVLFLNFDCEGGLEYYDPPES
jgi:hypothetical protein